MIRWKCFACGSARPCQPHHTTYNASGGADRVSKYRGHVAYEALPYSLLCSVKEAPALRHARQAHVHLPAAAAGGAHPAGTLPATHSPQQSTARLNTVARNVQRSAPSPAPQPGPPAGYSGCSDGQPHPCPLRNYVCPLTDSYSRPQWTLVRTHSSAL